MGHTRLGALPKTRKWNELLRHIAGMRSPENTADSVANDINAIAAQTLGASRKALAKVAQDSGVGYTFYLLTQVALASRTTDWETALVQHGIRLSSDSTVFDLTVELQGAIDRYLLRTQPGATDLSEMAQQSAGEALLSLAGLRTPNLFGGSSADAKNAIRSLSTKTGFGKLGQKFFGRFVARFLNFYLSRATAATLGSARVQNLGDITEFNKALELHCHESARIVRDFCGDWYSKTEYERGIELRDASKFVAVAVRKLGKELEHQRAEL
jgi:hypothetical protein